MQVPLYIYYVWYIRAFDDSYVCNGKMITPSKDTFGPLRYAFCRCTLGRLKYFNTTKLTCTICVIY